MHALDALSNVVRRKLVQHLAKRPRTVAELAEAFPITRPAISRHLKVLSDAGLVEVVGKGRDSKYALVPKGLRPAREWLEAVLDSALG